MRISLLLFSACIERQMRFYLSFRDILFHWCLHPLSPRLCFLFRRRCIQPMHVLSSKSTVLSAGRCLSTCAKNQFFDKTGGTCQKCDDTCSSCRSLKLFGLLEFVTGLERRNLRCCELRECCFRPGCLSLRVLVVTKTTDSAAPRLPSVTGLDSPTVIVQKTRLEWWQILLMVLGCVFILVAVLWCCRRRQRKKHMQKTELYTIGEVRNRGQISLHGG